MTPEDPENPQGSEDPEGSEDLLWELSRLEETGEETPPADLSADLLRAFREGRLSEPEAAEVEDRLARSPAARARLRELAGLGTAAPPPELRERALAGFGKRPRPRWLTRRLPAAAALAASLLIAVLWSQRPEGLPPGLAYDVTARGLASDRAAGPSQRLAGGIRVHPDTPVRLEVSPRTAAEADVDFGLYRVRDGRLERIVPGPALTAESERGAARFSGLARDLIGSEPGARDLFIVVARKGDLPEDRPLEPEEDPGQALAGEEDRRLVYVQTLRALPEGSQGKDTRTSTTHRP